MRFLGCFDTAPTFLFFCLASILIFFFFAFFEIRLRKNQEIFVLYYCLIWCKFLKQVNIYLVNYISVFVKEPCTPREGAMRLDNNRMRLNRLCMALV